MLAVANQLGYKDLKSFNAAIAADPKLHAQSRQQILDLYRKYIDQMYPQLPQQFEHLPKAKLEVLPVEEFREKEAPAAEYYPPAMDGSRPAHVMVNTGDFEKRSSLDIETNAYHEGVPGHHLQIALAQELPQLPPFRQNEYYTAYTEGWALYSEQLGKELGYFQDPYSYYGHLQCQMLRAIRLVVDTGLHYKHWTASKWSTIFTTIPAKTKSMCNRRPTVTSLGPLRRWDIRSASSRSWNCANTPKTSWAINSISGPSTTRCWVAEHFRWTY